MRLLLSVILSCFFFAAPLEGRATDIPVYKLDQAPRDIPKGGLLQMLVSDNCPAVITPSFHSTTYSTRNSFFCFADFINTVLPVNSTIALPEKKYFSRPYLYCKPIGLKLLFPEHYFW